MEDDEEAGTDDKKDSGKSASDSDLAQRLKRLERQNKEKERELERYRQAEQTKTDAEKSELERAKSRIAELEGSITERDKALAVARKRAAFELAAYKAGVVDVEAATMLASLDDLEVSEDGSVLGTEDLMKALQEKRPFLFGSANRDEPSAFGGGGNTGGAPGVRLYSAEEIQAMDAEAFAKFDSDVKAGRARPK